MARKLTIHQWDALEFVQGKSTKSQIVRVTVEDKKEVYVVDMTNPSSAALTLAGVPEGGTVALKGSVSAVTKVVSMVMAVKAEAVKSMTLSIHGAKPIDA